MNNVNKPPIKVDINDLKYFDKESSRYKRWCPVCDKGLLLVTRNSRTMNLSRYDRCTTCGQVFEYLNDTIAGEKVEEHNPEELDEWGGAIRDQIERNKMNIETTEIIALGTGAAFTLRDDNWQTNFIIKRNNKCLMVDCGGDARWSMKAQGFTFKDIDGAYLSHGHQDHAGGLEFLGFTRYFTKKAMEDNKVPNPIPLPKLYCERNVMKDLWDRTLRGGMESLEGIECNLETFFDVHPVEKNGSFDWEGLTFDIVQSLHISSKYSIIDSFGLMFTDNGKRIYITTDVQYSPINAMHSYYKEADFIIHDCETMYRSGVHAHYDDLKTLPEDIKAKMRLVHYQDNVLDDWDTWQNKAVNEDGFAGFVKPGLIYKTER